MSSNALEALDRELAAAHLRGQWQSEAFLSRGIGGPPSAGALTAWRWGDVARWLDRAGQAMAQAQQARRSLIFQNPKLPRGTTHTINMGVQMIMAGETAWAHRHSISALRFIIEGGPKLTTIVDGHDLVMENFDLVLTPNWSWHDHHNHGDRPAYWLDVLDVPLVLSLNQVFYEPGTAVDQGPPDDARYAHAILRYPWRDVEAALMQTLISERDGQVYVYPGADGGPIMPTLGCSLLRLPPGFSTKPRRVTSSSAHFCLRGEGAVTGEDGEIAFGPRDCFAVPNWSTHRFVNRSTREDAVIFCVTDAPVLRALGLLRSEYRA